jgi:hypothetical protein
MLKLKGKPAFGSCQQSAKFSLLKSLQHWQQLRAFSDLDFSQLVCQLMGYPAQMEDFHPQ